LIKDIQWMKKIQDRLKKRRTMDKKTRRICQIERIWGRIIQGNSIQIRNWIMWKINKLFFKIITIRSSSWISCTEGQEPSFTISAIIWWMEERKARNYCLQKRKRQRFPKCQRRKEEASSQERRRSHWYCSQTSNGNLKLFRYYKSYTTNALKQITRHNKTTQRKTRIL